MSITGKEGGPIDLATAKQWTANYRRSGKGKLNCHIFGKETIEQLLQQEGCVGISIYYAHNDQGQQQLLLVGVDAEGNTQTEGAIMDKSRVCPPDCGSAGELDG